MCKRAWRKAGKNHNEEASKEAGERVRHQGRKHKNEFILPNAYGVSKLMQKLLSSIGLYKQP